MTTWTHNCFSISLSLSETCSHFDWLIYCPLSWPSLSIESLFLSSLWNAYLHFDRIIFDYYDKQTATAITSSYFLLYFTLLVFVEFLCYSRPRWIDSCILIVPYEYTTPHTWTPIRMSSTMRNWSSLLIAIHNTSTSLIESNESSNKIAFDICYCAIRRCFSIGPGLLKVVNSTLVYVPRRRTFIGVVFMTHDV